MEIEDNCSILKEKGNKRISPFFIPRSLVNMANGVVSIIYKFKGPSTSYSTACTAGLENKQYNK